LPKNRRMSFGEEQVKFKYNAYQCIFSVL